MGGQGGPLRRVGARRRRLHHAAVTAAVGVGVERVPQIGFALTGQRWKRTVTVPCPVAGVTARAVRQGRTVDGARQTV